MSLMTCSTVPGARLRSVRKHKRSELGFDKIRSYFKTKKKYNFQWNHTLFLGINYGCFKHWNFKPILISPLRKSIIAYKEKNSVCSHF